jgi:hypothetical protein
MHEYRFGDLFRLRTPRTRQCPQCGGWFRLARVSQVWLPGSMIGVFVGNHVRHLLERGPAPIQFLGYFIQATFTVSVGLTIQFIRFEQTPSDAVGLPSHP